MGRGRARPRCAALLLSAAWAARSAAELTLAEHLRGHWEAVPDDQRNRYLTPEELQHDLNIPTSYFDVRRKALFAFQGNLGHQTGCNTTPFRTTVPPVINLWQVPGAEHPRVPGIVRLVRAAAGRTLCFAGDSVTLQFYTAPRNLAARTGLNRGPRIRLRPEQLQSVRPNARSVSREHVQKVKDETGILLWWGGLSQLQYYWLQEEGSRAPPVRIMYVKHYVHQPWDMEYFEECDLLVMNIAMHYGADGQMKGRDGGRYADAVSGLMQWAVNFTSSAPQRRRVAIWRETAPQHFRNPELPGVWPGFRAVKDCAPLPDLSDKQPYNKAADRVAASLASPCRTVAAGQGRWLRVNPARSPLHDFWAKNNWTSAMQAEASRRAARGGAQELDGLLWTWTIWDLLAPFPELHTLDEDCTHWCFAPTVWDAAFERLALVIEEAQRPHQCVPPPATPLPATAPPQGSARTPRAQGKEGAARELARAHKRLVELEQRMLAAERRADAFRRQLEEAQALLARRPDDSTRP